MVSDWKNGMSSTAEWENICSNQMLAKKFNMGVEIMNKKSQNIIQLRSVLVACYLLKIVGCPFVIVTKLMISFLIILKPNS